MTRRDCERVSREWLGRFDGAWAADEETAYRAHLAGCASCRTAIDEETLVISALSREQAQFSPTPATQLFLDHLATRALAEARSEARAHPAWRIAWPRLAFVSAALVAGVFLLFAAVGVQTPERAASTVGADVAGGGLDGMMVALGELETDDLPEVEALAAPAAAPPSSFEISMGGMNREELRLLDDELHLDLPPDFAEIEAAMVAGAGGDGQIDDALDDLTDAELREVGDKIGREIGRESGAVARERRGG